MSARKTKRKSCLPFSHPSKLRKLAKSLKVPFKTRFKYNYMNEKTFIIWCEHYGGRKVSSVPWSKEKLTSTTFIFKSDLSASQTKKRLKEIGSCPNVERIGEYLQFHI